MSMEVICNYVIILKNDKEKTSFFKSLADAHCYATSNWSGISFFFTRRIVDMIRMPFAVGL